MQTTPEFTWRPHSKTGRAKKLPAFTFVVGIVIGHCWHLLGSPVSERSQDLAVVRIDPMPGVGGAPVPPAVSLPAEVVPPPPPLKAASVRTAESPARVDPSPEHHNSPSTASGRTYRGPGTVKRQRAASVQKPENESDYAALREFLLKQ